jgi:hypothetical protein
MAGLRCLSYDDIMISSLLDSEYPALGGGERPLV